jgi:uncharacterized damage-inducible protein DinB
MLILADLYRYNVWANARVFEACASVDTAALQEDARGTLGTIDETLKHLVGVEDVYLAMIQGHPPASREAREAYPAHDLAWFADRARQLGDGYLDLLSGEGDALLERPLTVPWFNFPLTARDGLLQVLSHSAQHRSQVLSTLGARGVEAPNIDYVYMVGSTRA